ncbi:MAG: hypothetical protein Q7S02_06425 [bacterium]|nr:hypothetical protein [bacterium]
MMGVLLAAFGTLFEEVATSIGKWEVRNRVESVYSFGFLQLFWGGVLMVGIAIVRPDTFVFSFASLPTFLTRCVLEVIQAFVTVMAVVRASRSTVGFLRIGTIPLLLGFDAVAGYLPSTAQLFGIAVIIATLILLLWNHGLDRAGAGYIAFSAVNAVATVSLFQYDIRNFNSVVGEQLPIYILLIVYFAVAARMVTGEYPFRLLAHRTTFAQSFIEGVGGVVSSFAILFAPAAIVFAAKRSSAVLWSVLAGRITFHESRFLLKIVATILLIIGMVFLTGIVAW